MVGCGKVCNHGVNPACAFSCPHLCLQDLQALLEQELQLHRQIYSAIWAAVAAMERWSSGVSRWQAKVIADTNTWLAENAALIARHAGPAAVGTAYSPVPLPPVVDLSHSLRPQHQEQQRAAAAAAVNAAMGEFGAAVVITAQKVCGDAGLEGPSTARGGDSSEASSPTATAAAAQAGHWAEFKRSGGGAAEPGAAAGGSSSSGRVSRPSVELPGSITMQGAAEVLLAADPGASSIRSPGGVSLHSRTPGHHRQPLSLVSRLEVGSSSRSSGGGAGAPGDEAIMGFTSGSLASPAHHRPKSANRNQVVPLGAAGYAADVMAATAFEAQQQPQQEAALLEGRPSVEGEAHKVDVARLPTISGKAPITRLQPMGSPRP